MEPKREFEKKEREEIFSRYVNAGRRRYFFDVKATRADDYYLTITESTKQYNDDGTDRYERHRIFLYKEDFDKFTDKMREVMDFIKRERGDAPQSRTTTTSLSSHEEVESPRTAAPEKAVKGGAAPGKKAKKTAGESSEFTDVKFEDLEDIS